jgi:DNA-binding MarR family transcriptional regulator
MSAAAAAPGGTPSLADARALTDVVRDLFMLAKQRHRQTHDQTTDHGRISVLLCLKRQGPARVSDLSREISLDQSTTSRHVRTLEEEGLLAKSADPDDKRAWRVQLTEAGTAHIDQLWDSRVREVADALGTWTTEDVHTLTDLLRRFVCDTEGRI